MAVDYLHGTLRISSTDLRSWTKTAPPYLYSSLTVYQSNFVLVGGYDLSTKKPTNHLRTSTTGLDWTTSLPAMPTSRYATSSVSGGSPEVLVVVGGRGSLGEYLDVVDVLINDHWTTADSLPTLCWNMQSTFHEGNFYFTGGTGAMEILFICSLESFIASASNDSTRTRPMWRKITTPVEIYDMVSYLSNLIGIDEESNIKSYSSKTETWIETTSEGDVPNDYGWKSISILSTGQFVIANEEGVYKGTLSG